MTDPLTKLAAISEEQRKADVATLARLIHEGADISDGLCKCFVFDGAIYGGDVDAIFRLAGLPTLPEPTKKTK